MAGVALVLMACAAPASAFDGFVRPGIGGCWYPGAGVWSPEFGGYCDYPVEGPNGMHWRCEWVVIVIQIGSCHWRWSDNTLARPPTGDELEHWSEWYEGR